MTKSDLRKKRLILPYLKGPSSREAKAGTNRERNLKAGIEEEVMQEQSYCLTPRLTFSYLYYRAQFHVSKDHTTHNVLGPSTTITNPESA